MPDASDPPAYDTDRQNSLLTNAQREWLIERPEPETDDERAVARQNRYRLRERLRQGIQDFTLLLELLSDEDRRDLFAPENVEDDEAVALSEGFHDLLAFAYLCHQDQGWDFDAGLISAFHRAAAAEGMTLRHGSAETVFEVFDPSTEELKARFDAQERPALASHELQALVDQGVVDPTEGLLYRAEMRAQHRENTDDPGSTTPPPEEQLDRLNELLSRRGDGINE